MSDNPIYLDTDIASLSRRLAMSLNEELEKEIKSKLMSQADIIVSKLAKEMAQNLSTNIKAHNDVAGDRLQIYLVIDGVSELVK